MAAIRKIDAREIDAALLGTTRQYLVGKLGRPQALRHIESDLIEIGITKYDSQPAFEAPHSHGRAFEYMLMLEGLTAYLNVDTGEEHVYRKGDFFMIEPGVLYAQKSAAGTAILFAKVPPGNDKIPAESSAEVKAWLEAPLPLASQ